VADFCTGINPGQAAPEDARAIHGLKDLSEKDLMRLREEVRDSFCVPKGGYKVY